MRRVCSGASDISESWEQNIIMTDEGGSKMNFRKQWKYLLIFEFILKNLWPLAKVRGSSDVSLPQDLHVVWPPPSLQPPALLSSTLRAGALLFKEVFPTGSTSPMKLQEAQGSLGSTLGSVCFPLSKKVLREQGQGHWGHSPGNALGWDGVRGLPFQGHTLGVFSSLADRNWHILKYFGL